MPILFDEPDLFVFREEPLVDVEDEFGPSFFLLLRNFDHNSKALKPQHREALGDRVVNFIKTSVGFAELYAMTDRSGSPQVNYKVSALRLTEVQQHLLGLGATPGKVQHAFAKAVGEDFFEERFKRDKSKAFIDGKKDGSFRLVAIALTPAPIGVPTKNFRARIVADVVGFCRKHVQKK